MNVAVKTINSVSVLSPRILTWTLSLKKIVLVCIFALVVTISAFAVIYVQDVNRRLLGNLQNLASARVQLQSQWSQLLLEQSTWSAQARIQQMASKKFNMLIPAPKSIVMVDAKGEWQKKS